MELKAAARSPLHPRDRKRYSLCLISPGVPFSSLRDDIHALSCIRTGEGTWLMTNLEFRINSQCSEGSERGKARLVSCWLPTFNHPDSDWRRWRCGGTFYARYRLLHHHWSSLFRCSNSPTTATTVTTVPTNSYIPLQASAFIMPGPWRAWTWAGVVVY